MTEGMDQGTAPNVYDFPMREYGIQGRWPSPDPAGFAAVNPMDPQTWNRYAYVRNSPLEMIDPLGLCSGKPPDPAHPCAPPPPSLDGPNSCTLDENPVPCQIAEGAADSGAAVGCPENSCGPREGSNGFLYLPSWTPDGWGYTNPLNGDVFFDGMEFGLPGLGDGDTPPYLVRRSGPSISSGATQQTGTTSKVIKWLTQYVPCALAGDVTHYFGDEGRAGATILLNAAPFAPANLLKGGPVPYLVTAGVWDIGNAVQIEQECTAQVYGGD